MSSEQPPMSSSKQEKKVKSVEKQAEQTESLKLEKEIRREKQEKQIKILQKISTLFNESGIKWWLTGGFALEVNLGEQSMSREHGDIDIIIPNSDIIRAKEFFL